MITIESLEYYSEIHDEVEKILKFCCDIVKEYGIHKDYDLVIEGFYMSTNKEKINCCYTIYNLYEECNGTISFPIDILFDKSNIEREFILRAMLNEYKFKI